MIEGLEIFSSIPEKGSLRPDLLTTIALKGSPYEGV